MGSMKMSKEELKRITLNMALSAEKRGGSFVNPDGTKATNEDLFDRALSYLDSDEKYKFAQRCDDIIKSKRAK